MVRVSCQAGNLLEFAVSRNLISSSWSTELDSLEEYKRKLLELEVKDSRANEFLSSNTKMDYENSIALRDILQRGEDGKAKRFWIGSFTSPVVKGWMHVVDAYEKHNLFLAERARDLKRLIKEYAAVQKSIIDRGHTIASVEEKLEMHAATVAGWHRSLDDIRTRFGIACDDHDALTTVSSFFNDEKCKAQQRVDTFVTKTSLQTSSHRTTRLALEEEYFYLKTLDPHFQLASDFEEAIADIIYVDSIDVDEETIQEIRKIESIKARINNDREHVRLQEIITKCRNDIADMNRNLIEIEKEKEQLVERIRKYLASIAPHVDLVF